MVNYLVKSCSNQRYLVEVSMAVVHFLGSVHMFFDTGVVIALETSCHFLLVLKQLQLLLREIFSSLLSISHLNCQEGSLYKSCSEGTSRCLQHRDSMLRYIWSRNHMDLGLHGSADVIVS